MKKFIRYIENIAINIMVEEEFFEKNRRILNIILRLYSEVPRENMILDREFNYYIYQKDYEEYIINDAWIFLLIKRIEEFYEEILKCTAIHGACVNLGNKNYLIIGERYSGKTTLTQYLTIKKNGKYVDDDCIYIYNNKYIGSGMPLLIRDNRKADYEKYFVAHTIDTDGIERNIYSPLIYLDNVKKVDIVIFPKYGEGNMPYIGKLSQTESFDGLLRNIHKYYSMQILFRNIKYLVKAAACYCINYSSSEMAYDLLEQERLIIE